MDAKANIRVANGPQGRLKEAACHPWMFDKSKTWIASLRSQ
jgi:hypothetical protein